MKSLILAEKPSVAREIARVLGCKQKHKNYIEGSRYVVTWALGHLVTLAEPEDYDTKYKTWKMEDLPIMPKRMDLKVIRQTSQQFKAISQLAKRKELNELIIATDAGREGELVARWIMEKVHWRQPFKRLWISSQTDKAIRDGFAKLKTGKQYDDLYHSAVCRAEADWLIGLNVTRALTSKYNESLSAGRVQTPTLAMLMEREREIGQFRSQEYRTLEADFGRFRAVWRDAKTQDSRLFDPEQAQALFAKVKGKTGKVSAYRTSERVEAPPLPYDLTELQRDANRRFGFSAKQTSNVLQRLYEQHKLTTYPRTDSRYLTSDMVATLPDRLKAVSVGPYAPLIKGIGGKPAISKRAVDDRKVTDHHAIIPTEERPQLARLSPEERKLYDIIVRRYIALFYPVYRYDQVKLTTEAAGQSFHASGRRIKQQGWKEVYGADTSALDEDDDDSDTSDKDSEQGDLPLLKPGDSLTVQHCELKNGRTRPPARYTEARLLSQMEKHNLGTPATRADIIEKLLSTDTIERQGTSLVPTGKGKQLIELVASDLRSPELTAEWEQQLERIARGKGNTDSFLSGIRKQTEQMVQQIKQSTYEYKPHNLTVHHCPKCGEPLKEVKRKRGKTLVCINTDCDYSRSDQKQLTNRRCPQCRKKMEIRSGKKGKFFHCRGCNVIEMLDEQGAGGKGRSNRKDNKQMINKYSDNTKLSSSLGDALKAAMQDDGEE